MTSMMISDERGQVPDAKPLGRTAPGAL